MKFYKKSKDHVSHKYLFVVEIAVNGRLQDREHSHCRVLDIDQMAVDAVQTVIGIVSQAALFLVKVAQIDLIASGKDDRVHLKLFFLFTINHLHLNRGFREPDDTALDLA